MNNEKKVILFIVEGGSDKIFFSEFEKVFTEHHVLVHSVKGDVFSNRNIKNVSMKIIVKEIIEKVLKDNSVLGLIPKDIDYIFHITDTDCCFQQEEFSNYSLTVIRRSKAEKINDVITMQRYMPNDDTEKYKLLYFAPNLEGPLTPSFEVTNQRLEGADKSRNMIKLISTLRNDSNSFEESVFKLFNKQEIAPFAEYYQSWDFIREGNNSQGNYTNLKFVFEEEGIK